MLLELTPVVRYWEFTAKELEGRLQKLRDENVRTVAAWIPWSFLETDRLHLLQKMLRHSFELGLKVKLGVSPELGIGFPNNGLPEDILKERGTLAQDRTGQVIYNCAPPNIHPLPSLSAPPVFQKYGHFLLKLSQELNDVLYEMPQHSVEFVVSDSLFKHYHTTGLPPEDHGDFSVRYLHQGSSGVSQGASPSGAESIFLNRTRDFLKTRFAKYKNVTVTERKVFSRSASLDRLTEELARSGANLPSLFKDMADARSHSQLVWLDDLFGLSDRERNFLISAALVTYQQVWISEDIFQQCSPAFRRRIQNLIEGFSREEVAQKQVAAVFVKNRFAPARLAQNLREKLGARLSFETLQFGPLKQFLGERRLVVVEEGLPLEFQQYVELMNYCKESTATVVVFKSSLDERAVRDLSLQKKFHVERGWNYDIVMQPSGGQILFIEGEESSQTSLVDLAESVISVAQLQPWCRLDCTSSAVYTVSIDWVEQNIKTLFLLNPRPEAQPLSLSFSTATKVQGIFLGNEERSLEPMRGEIFEGTLPGFSVVPLTAYLQSSPTSQELSEYDGSATELA